MGHASISSRRVSIGLLLTRRRPALWCEAATYALEQLPSLSVSEPRSHRYVPHSCAREQHAFYGILVCHEHGKLVIECQIRGHEGMMVREGMLEDIDTAGAQ